MGGKSSKLDAKSQEWVDKVNKDGLMDSQMHKPIVATRGYRFHYYNDKGRQQLKERVEQKAESNMKLRDEIKDPAKYVAPSPKPKTSHPMARQEEVPDYVDPTAYFMVPEDNKPIEEGFYARNQHAKEVFVFVKGGKAQLPYGPTAPKEKRLADLEAELYELAGLQPPAVEEARLRSLGENRRQGVKEPEEPKLHVNILNPVNVLAPEDMLKANLYAVLAMGEYMQPITTATINGAAESAWNEEHTVDVTDPEGRLELSLFNTVGGKEHLLGQGAVELSALVRGEATPVEVILFLEDDDGQWVAPREDPSLINTILTAVGFGLPPEEAADAEAAPDEMAQPQAMVDAAMLAQPTLTDIVMRTGGDCGVIA